ncbi:hypothetical protein CPB83DRAFT_781911 [Crepidotus variabilis]|uniref:Zn(2)-C6 fungal-type domain-containing protein n=1 Tax=Crepidotus variabilis TaxID=179855 RepID=A0A9P6JVZ1_9AGAR|nr:hypothetical protein CPB83DRAFT_781911 [Crepidotus variabilis]
MSSSKSRSPSAEIVPSTGTLTRDPASLVNGTVESQKEEEREEDADADADAELEEEQAPLEPPKASTSAMAGNAPTPCERCVRTNRVCKGVGGARCEYCKRLKQKCSNSSGPARGKSAAAAKKAAAEAAAKSKGTAISAPPAFNNVKRKLPDKALGQQNGDIDGASLDGDGSVIDDDHSLPPRLTKRRRISKGGKGPSRTELIQTVADMESSIKRIQTSVAKEVDRMQGVIDNLNGIIADMDSD